MNSVVFKTILYTMIALVLPGITHAQMPLGNEWTYQGRLNMAGSPLNDTADFEFMLWDADAAGNVVGAVATVNNVIVVDGLFTVELDFGAEAFNGDERWLEIAVRSPAGVGDYTTLSPRQPLTATPYALQTRGLFVNDGGNVGIGTTTPGSKLDVEGTVRVKSTVKSGAGPLILSGSGWGVHVHMDEDGGSSDAFRIFDEEVERFSVDGDTGTVTAAAFVGDGSGLTNVDAFKAITGDIRIANGISLRTLAVLLDQEQVSGASGFGATSDSWQSFTAGLSGELSSVGVFRADDGQEGTIELYEGEGTAGTFLSSATIPAMTNTEWQYAEFPDAIPVVAGNQYSIRVLTAPGGHQWRFGLGDPYVGGRSQHNADADFRFRTFMVDPSAVMMDSLRVDGGTGNVGIGTSFPTTKLDVGGTVTATSFVGDGSGLTNLPASWIETGADIYYDAGNVGIGTISPEELLHVSGGDLALDHAGANNSTRSIHLRGRRQGASSAFAKIDFSNFDPDGAQEDQPVARIASFNSDLTDSGDLRFFTVEDYGLYGSSLERMRITETGNVGIGTSTPASELEVIGSVTATSFVGDGSGLTNLPASWNESGADIYYDAGNVGIGTNAPNARLHIADDVQNADLRLESTNGNSSDRARFIMSISDHEWAIENDGNTDLWKVRDNTAGKDRLSINYAGNVGIGTNDPRNALDVVGNTPLTTGVMSIQNTHQNGFSGIYFHDDDGVKKAYAGWINTNAEGLLGPGTIQIGGLDTTASAWITMDPDTGNVGINKASPNFTLEVNGTAGKPGGGSWSNSSDRRLKKDIQDLKGALDRLMELHGVTFEYRDPEAINELPGTRIGVIAQEVEQVFPDWVSTGGHGYKTVTFRGFEALTVEALRELRTEKGAEIAELQARIDAQQTQIDALVRQVNALTKAMTAK